ncbi:GNAT family N-acetyltransferase [Bacilliculturomica massiliensis]|uniref:GNAT family N-acetyltransferase n=1 Tax=Bacilliculturomica massiliensis TaxID=1917867 RepID=UPI001030F36C|nr:GNAT family N-acetyltransferase [Bacilliculturomica massiliensis]
MKIRYITPADDRGSISKVYEESWKYAYKGMIPQDYLDSIQEGRWITNLENSDWSTLVCIEDEKIVGTSSFSRSRFQQFPGWGEIISIYLLTDYMGKGLGKALLDSVIVEMRKMGHENLFLWVLEENLKARHFYEKAGFLMTDDYLDDNIGGKELREICYIYRTVDQNAEK